MKLVTWFLKANEDRHGDAALAFERSRGENGTIRAGTASS